MKATDIQRPPTDSDKDPFATYVVLSAVVHGMLILGVMGGAWWWRTPTYYKPAPYSVSLVDAPVSLRQPAPAGGSKEPAREAETPRPQQTPPAPPPPEKRPDVAPPQAVPPPEPPAPKKPAVAATPPPEPPTPKKPAVATPAPPKKPEPTPKREQTVKARPKPRQTPKRPKASTRQRPSTREAAKTAKREAPSTRKPEPPSRSRRPSRATSSAAAEQANQQAAEQRLAALRERFGSGALGTGTSSETADGLQEVRLRAYQELVREQIIEAWILPMTEQEARSLQATALLTVERDGRVTHVKLLEPSGHALFDDSLLRAIAQVTPLPALPEDYRGGILELELRFRAGGA